MAKNHDELEDIIISLINTYLESSEEEQVKTWEEHEAATKAAEENTQDEAIDIDSMPLVDKLGSILHGVCNNILAENIRLETGQETYALAKAIEVRENLRNGSCRS